MTLIRSYGEFELIRRIRQRLHPPGDEVMLGIGDDAAAVRPTPGMATLYSTDTLVEQVDFVRDFSSWDQVGWKSMAANLSDIAAKGGIPRYALVTLCLPDDMRVEEVDALIDGMERLARQHDTAVIGGDLSGTPGPAAVSITIIGEAPPDQFVLRSGARIGDALCVTGHLGASAAGLRLLHQHRQNAITNAGLNAFARVLEKHRTPEPRIEEGRMLAASGWVHAMIDISDGLSADALHLAQDSKTGISLFTRDLPVEKETRQAAGALGLDPVQLALHSGEEFELLCAVDARNAGQLCQKVTEATGTAMAVIGEITPISRGYIRYEDGKKYPLHPEGYDHFKYRRSEAE